MTVYAHLVDSNVELGDYKEAVAAAQWLLDLRPGNVAGLTRAAYLRELHGDPAGAVELMQSALDSTPLGETEERAWLLTQLSHLHLQMNSVQRSQSYAEQALRAFPDYHYALGALAQVHTVEGHWDEAVSLLQKRYRLAPHAENLYGLAEALRSAGRDREAAAAFADFEDAAVRESALADNANRELTAYYADVVHRPEKALEVAKLEYGRRQDIFTLDAYAWALANSGDYAGARKAMARALATGVKDARLLYHAGVIALKSGDRAGAEKYLNTAASLHLHDAELFVRAVTATRTPPQP